MQQPSTPSADHLVSWGGLAPGSHESAGKRKPVATRRGSHWLRVFLVQAAWAATHAKGTFWKRTFERLRARLGPKQALIAIARKMLVALYHVLKNRTPYRELGAIPFPSRWNADHVEARANATIEKVTRGAASLEVKRRVLRDLLNDDRVVVSWPQKKPADDCSHWAAITLPAFGSLPSRTVRTDEWGWAGNPDSFVIIDSHIHGLDHMVETLVSAIDAEEQKN